MLRPVSIVIYVALVIMGFVVGVAGAFVQAIDTSIAGVPVPYGLVIAVGAAASAFWLARLIAPRGRAGVIVASAAWLVGVLPLSTGRPEGDIILPGGDARSYAYLFLPVLIAAALATLPSPDRRHDGAG